MYNNTSKLKPVRNCVTLRPESSMAAKMMIMVWHLTNCGSKNIHQIFEKNDFFCCCLQTVWQKIIYLLINFKKLFRPTIISLGEIGELLSRRSFTAMMSTGTVSYDSFLLVTHDAFLKPRMIVFCIHEKIDFDCKILLYLLPCQDLI
jgi:hypothetical protein